ncbi:MAG: hypothetical protein M3Y28_08225, partial [Armatimonadota bacterium]|nr:hypothetical protein [Armatimonadota bacterium]
MKAFSQMFRQISRVRVTPLRLALAALIVAGLTLAFTSATSVAAAGRTGHTGQALALRTALLSGSAKKFMQQASGDPSAQ